MLYCHGSGTSGISCTPLLPGTGRRVLFVGHPGHELPVPGSSEGCSRNVGIPAKPGSQRWFDLGSGRNGPEWPVWPRKAAKPRSSGLSARTGRWCACYPKHLDGTARTGQFLAAYPWSQARSTFTREPPEAATVRLEGRPPLGAGRAQGSGNTGLAAFGGQTGSSGPFGP